MVEKTKRCSRCRAYLPTSTFTKDKSKKDGLHSTCKPCDHARDRDWAKRNKIAQRISSKKRHQRIYQQVVDGYGGKCCFCGCEKRGVFVLHHPNGGGTAHVRQLPGTQALYRWALKNGFPDSLMLVCANCHLLIHRGQNGYFWEEANST